MEPLVCLFSQYTDLPLISDTVLGDDPTDVIVRLARRLDSGNYPLSQVS